MTLKTIWEDHTDIEVISDKNQLTYEDWILEETNNLAVLTQLNQ